jgi:hypothetical protein
MDCRIAILILFLCLTAPNLVFAQDSVVKCVDGKEIDPYIVWTDIRNNHEAAAFLRLEFERFQTPLEFATWLSCQGFDVATLDGPFGHTLKDGEIFIYAGFLIGPRDRPALWGATWIDRIFPKHAHVIDIYLDKYDKIFRIEVSLTSK